MIDVISVILLIVWAGVGIFFYLLTKSIDKIPSTTIFATDKEWKEIQSKFTSEGDK